MMWNTKHDDRTSGGESGDAWTPACSCGWTLPPVGTRAAATRRTAITTTKAVGGPAASSSEGRDQGATVICHRWASGSANVAR